jgi:hypothetical protein
MTVIGSRKMAVIIWCSAMIATVMVFYIIYNQKLDTAAITGMGLIAGLGGFHNYKQGQVDNANGKE